jgi:hypothetical protein
MSIKRSCTSVLLFGLVAVAGQNGRYAILKEQAFLSFERGQYDQVAGKLEEIWEQDKSDPKVAEYLAMGYLYGEKSVTKAEPVMLAAFDKGGQATFLMLHSHEKAFTNGVINNFCTGKMIVHKGKLSFVGDSGGHSFDFTASQAADVKLLGGSSPGRLQFQQGPKTKVIFRVKTTTKDEADLFDRVLQQAMK